MKKITTEISILTPSDIIERHQHDFDVTNLKEFVKYFKFESFGKVMTSNLVLFIDDYGNTTILKNRYGKPQI